MLSVGRDAVRSVDAAIDFGTAKVRVATDSQHVRVRRSVRVRNARWPAAS